MKTAELTGAMLDYWVARAEGFKSAYILETTGKCYSDDANGFWYPSTFWMQGGPIIERNAVAVEANGSDFSVVMYSEERFEYCQQSGPTLLIAAMRAFVASRFGVDVPEV